MVGDSGFSAREETTVPEVSDDVVAPEAVEPERAKEPPKAEPKRPPEPLTTPHGAGGEEV